MLRGIKLSANWNHFLLTFLARFKRSIYYWYNLISSTYSLIVINIYIGNIIIKTNIKFTIEAKDINCLDYLTVLL
jgi:hypothetical protein